MRAGFRRGGLQGVERLTRRLNLMRREAPVEAASIVAETAEETGEAARERLRRLPGRLPVLAERVSVEGTGESGAVVVRHPAAPHVEFGTHQMPPRPFLQKAADAARLPFRKRMMALAGKLMRSRP